MSPARRAFGLDAADTAVFLDVDGTLLGFRDHPAEVVADAALLDLLARLRTATGGALALVSGRTIADLDRIVAPMVLPAGGTHGAELRFADGRTEAMAGDALDALRPAVAALVAAHPGTMLEDKGAAFAVHYRHAPGAGKAIRRFLDETVGEGDVMVQHGKMVAEVKPRASSKGTAIAALMASPPFAGRTPLFIGDDLTDEKGFAAVNAAGGVSVKVGEGETQAARRCADVEEVRAALDALCAARMP